MIKEIIKGKQFLATLSSEEMEWVSDQLAENYASKQQAEDIFVMKTARDTQTLKQEYLASFAKQGNKHLLEILKGEFDGIEIKMGINIAGKQRDLVGLSDKILSIFQFIFANPQGFQQAMQIPGMSRAFEDILEFSGVSQVDFARLASMSPPVATPPQVSEPSPLQIGRPVAA